MDGGGVRIVEWVGRPTAFGLALGWLAAGLAAAWVEGEAAQVWMLSLPFAVIAIGLALASRRVIEAGPDGLAIDDLPFGRRLTLDRGEIARIAEGPAEGPVDGWSIVVQTHDGDARRLTHRPLPAEVARAVAHRVRTEIA